MVRALGGQRRHLLDGCFFAAAGWPYDAVLFVNHAFGESQQTPSDKQVSTANAASLRIHGE
jgi:hypothetical protein